MFFFFKQKTAYEMRISDWSSDVCSSDLKPASSEDPIGDRANHEQEGDDGPNDPIFQARTFDVPDPHGDLPSGSNRTPPRTCGNPIQLGIRQPDERFCFTARSSRQPHTPQHHVAPCDIDRPRPLAHRPTRVDTRPRKSGGRRVGKEGDSTCRYQWSPYT